MSVRKTTDDITATKLEKRRKAMEGTATFGLLLICVALVAPFVSPGDFSILRAFKWVYSAGALVYVIARVVGARDPRDSARVKRLRRMEFWAGVAFMAGAVFWFVQEDRLGASGGLLALMRETVMFTLAGAFIQIIASWLIVYRVKKEGSSDSGTEK